MKCLTIVTTSFLEDFIDSQIKQRKQSIQLPSFLSDTDKSLELLQNLTQLLTLNRGLTATDPILVPKTDLTLLSVELSLSKAQIQLKTFAWRLSCSLQEILQY